MLRISAILIVFLLAGFPARADRAALVIGNSAYLTETELANAGNDARDIAAALRRIGFRVTDGYDLTRTGMLELVRRFARDLGPGDTALFFYAGHGVQLGGENFLIPVDADFADEAALVAGSVRLGSVLRTMELRAETRIVILDACRSNPFVRSVASRSGAPAARGLAKVDAGVGSFIAFATQPGNVASDGGGRNSPFTAALVEHLDRPGENIHAVMRRVRADVTAATGGTQIPWENSSLVSEVFFVPPAGGTTGGTAAGVASGGPTSSAPDPGGVAVARQEPAATAPSGQGPGAGRAARADHYVDGLDPQGDNFLALRDAPSSRGRLIARMRPGTALEVLGREGAWREVRLEDGRQGWAHGNWIRCCRGAGASPAPAGSGAARTAEASCDELWLARNAIWHRHGYCFRGARGQRVFGNAGCSRDQAAARAAMSAEDAALVDRLVAQERAQGCR